MKANISLVLQGGTPEERANYNSRILLLLTSIGTVLRQLPLGGGKYHFLVELDNAEALPQILAEFEQNNPWLRIERVSVET